KFDFNNFYLDVVCTSAVAGENCSVKSSCCFQITCWEQHGRMCYYFSKIRASWQESRDKCERLRGDLVKIESWEEQV
uniref:C-type lectin domain-containing protein n=1 Tax=Mastacembelus armatus TaxID=205130 RepID=A0A7N9AZS9_9TELE